MFALIGVTVVLAKTSKCLSNLRKKTYGVLLKNKNAVPESLNIIIK